MSDDSSDLPLDFAASDDDDTDTMDLDDDVILSMDVNNE